MCIAIATYAINILLKHPDKTYATYI